MANEHPATIKMRAHSAMERWLLAEIENKHGVHVLSAETSFVQLGINELEFIELVMQAEEALGIEIPDGLSLKCETPAQLASLLDHLTDTVGQHA